MNQARECVYEETKVMIFNFIKPLIIDAYIDSFCLVAWSGTDRKIDLWVEMDHTAE